MRQLWLAPIVGMAMMGVPVMLLSSPGSSATPLDGTSWAVRAEPDASSQDTGAKPFIDTLVFRNGKVVLEGQRQQGFTRTDYTLTPSGYGWSFTAQQQSPREGETIWTADVLNGTMTGLLVWTKPNGSIARFSFRGQQLL